jgi:hypothetical protein
MIQVQMRFHFVVALSLIATLSAIRIEHKLDHVYSYAGNTHYATEKPSGEAHTLSTNNHLSLTNNGLAQANHKMAVNSSHKRHWPRSYG